MKIRAVLKNRFLLVVVFLALGLTPAAPGASTDSKSSEGDPTDLIGRFHTTLLGVMKEAKALGVRGRYERLEPAVREIFSLPLMIRIAAGTHWSKGSDAERQRLAEAFERMSVATYADRFDGYSGESFETVGRKPGPQATTLVETKLLRPKDDPIEITYVMREVRGEWRIVDVLLESGISELARYRSEYAKILKDRGLDGLIAELEAKTAKMLGPSVAGQR